ncbi:MAG: tetratricopeptide repeat protein [Gemmatimonadota bacterium]|nr:MAG: tetratricopeptide repeat protein [Gemmatimonadota bacterium]
MPPENDVQAEIEQLEQRFAENSRGLVFAHLADAYRRAGQFAKAEGLILHGLKNHPSYTTAYNVLGRVYLESERYADAHEQFSKVLELDPQNLIALRALGDLAGRGGRLDDARTWYERMLQVDPRNEEAKEELRKLEAGIAGVRPAPAVETPPAAEPDQPAAEKGEGAGEVEEIEFVEPEPLAGEAAAVSNGSVPESMPWDGAAEEGPVETAPSKLAQDATAPIGGAEPGEVTPAEPAPEGPARESTLDVSAAESAELDLGEMEEWTPGFLRDEDLAGEGGSDLSPDELFAELGGDLGADLSGAAEADEAGRDMVTETMAELYAEQGLYEDALGVYRKLIEIRPNDERIRARMAELQQLAESAVGDAGEELAELLELTEPDAAELSELSDAEAPAAPTEAESGFTFEDEAPVAGIEQLDPFAASFDVLAMQAGAGPPTPAMPVEPAAAEVSEPEPVALEELREEVILEGLLETALSADVVPAGADIAPPVEVERFAPAPVTPEPAVGIGQAAERATIEEYLAGLLAFNPEADTAPKVDAASSAVDAATSEDMEAFQAWLRSLKR